MQYDADGNRTVRTRISNAYAADYQTKSFYDYRNRMTDQEFFDNNGVLTKCCASFYLTGIGGESLDLRGRPDPA